MLIDLYIDVVNQKLIASKTNATQVATAFRESFMPLRVTLMRPNPTGGLSSKYVVEDISALDLRAGIGDASIELADDALALLDDWVKDEEAGSFTGRLNLNTDPIAALMLTADATGISKMFEIGVLEDGNYAPIYQQAITIKRNILRNSTVAPAEVPQISAFTNTLAQALRGSNSITLTRAGNIITISAKLDPAGHLVETNDGLAVDTTGLAEVDDLHDPVTFGDVSPNIIPAMTSDVLPLGYIASASQELTPAWKAFDGVVNSTGAGWTAATPPPPDPDCDCEAGHEPSVWLQIQFPTAKIVTCYVIVGPSNPDRAPQNWYFEGSNDGVSYHTLDTVADQSDWDPHEVRRFEIPHGDQSYTYYRLKITSVNGDAVTEVEELRMEDVCETIIAEIDGQVIFLRLRLAPGGHVICGPGGLRLDFEPFAFGENEGGVVYVDTAPDIETTPKYARWIWVDTSVSPRIALEYNSALGVWEPIDKGLAAGQGVILTSATPPDAINVPFYRLCAWIYDEINPPSFSIWNKHTNEWQNICSICSLSGGYPGRLPNVVFDPASGAGVPVSVSLSVPGIIGATIYYTTNGTDPTNASTEYTGTPIDLTDVTTLKAFAVKDGWLDSEISSAIYGEIEITSWLLNINYRQPGLYPEKTGKAATYDDQFSDFWNGLAKPEAQRPEYVLKNADGADATAKLEYSSFIQPTTFSYGSTTNVDPMFKTLIKDVDSFGRDLGLYFVLPIEGVESYGVYDLYAYGHGQADASNMSMAVNDEFGGRTAENTSTGSDWNNTTWTEAKQYVLFPDLEPVITPQVAPGHTIVPGVILAILKWNAGNTYLAGFQLRKKNQLPKVRFSPVSGSNVPTDVQLSCPRFPTATIYYTDDGSTPTTGSTEYTAPIHLTTAKTIKAIAVMDPNPNSIANSAVNSASYV